MYNDELKVASIFIELGRTLLQTPNLSHYIEETEEDIRASSREENVYSALKEDLGDLLKAAEEAKGYLSQVRLSSPHEEEETTTYNEPLVAFQALDDLVFLREGLEHAIKKNLFKDTSLLSDLDQWHLDTSAWFCGEGGFSALRLTVFQDIRRNILATFPEKVHYLFPWYCTMATEDQNILAEIISYYNKIADPTRHKELPLSLRENAPLYYMELVADKDLRSAVAREHKIWHAIGEGFSKSLAVRLLAIVEEASLDTPYPDDLLEYGFGAIAALILKDPKNIWNRREQVGMALLIGFCCEGLTDAVRFKLFSWVEDQMEKIDKVDADIPVDAGIGERAFSRLNTWMTAKIDRRWLYTNDYENGLYALWFSEMRRNKGKVAITDTVTEEELSKLAIQVIESYDNFSVAILQLVALKISYIALFVGILTKVIRPLSPRAVGMGPGAISPPGLPTQYNLIGIPWIRKEGERTIIFFDGSLQFVSEASAKSYKVYEYSQTMAYSYCALYLDPKGEMLDKKPPGSLPRIIGRPITLELPENTAAVLFGMGPRGSLEREWTILGTSQLPEVSEKSEVYWILFAPPADETIDSESG